MSKRKLLLADDSITIQKVVNLTFADEGIEVISVGDGNSAMDRLREESPDLVLADVNMPGPNGYEICEIIKQSGESGRTPVILLVGSFEPFDEEEARRVGADDYLTKPFQSISQLVEKVSALLEEEPAAAEPDIEDTVGMPWAAVEQPDSGEETGRFYADEATDEETETTDEEADTPVQTEQIGSLPIDDSSKLHSNVGGMSELGVDDEMIEEETPSHETGHAGDATGETPYGLTYEDYGGEDYNQTQPLTRADLRELSLDEPESDAGDATPDAGTPAEETSGETGRDEYAAAVEELSSMYEEDEEAGFEASRPSEPEIPHVEQHAEQQPSGEEPYRADTGEGEGFTFGLPPAADHPSGSAEDHRTEPAPESLFEMTEPAPGSTPAADETPAGRSSFESAPAAPELTDDEDLLDLPPLAGQTAREEVSGEVRTALREETDEISPELVEAITQKVVDRISDKAIREIAWEVVPELADLIIRRMAEEKMKE